MRIRMRWAVINIRGAYFSSLMAASCLWVHSRNWSFSMLVTSSFFTTHRLPTVAWHTVQHIGTPLNTLAHRSTLWHTAQHFGTRPNTLKHHSTLWPTAQHFGTPLNTLAHRSTLGTQLNTGTQLHPLAHRSTLGTQLNTLAHRSSLWPTAQHFGTPLNILASLECAANVQ